MISPRCNLSKAFLARLVSIAHDPVSVDRLKSKVGRCTFSQIPAWDYLRLYPRLKGRGPIEAFEIESSTIQRSLMPVGESSSCNVLKMSVRSVACVPYRISMTYDKIIKV